MQIFQTRDDPQIPELLKSGAVGVLPTDTVYGIVCQTADRQAVSRLYALKARENKPGTIIAGQLQQLIDLGIRGRYLKAVEQYWPNPLSVVIPCGEELSYLHLGQHSLAVRIPADEQLRSLLHATGPLLTTSANEPSKPTAVDMPTAQAYFSSQIDFYVDGGTIINHRPSTVIRIVDDAIEILRPGAVAIDENGRITA